MSAQTLPPLCLLAIGLGSSVVVAISDTLSGDWVVHAFASVLAASILATLALVQKWEQFAWLPLVGFAVGCVGFIVGYERLDAVGYFMFAVLTIWHGHQKEKRKSPAVGNE